MKHAAKFISTGKILFLIFAITLYSSSVYADGYIGEHCDNGVCYEGVCNEFNECEHCGWPGYRCCPGGACYGATDEYQCVGGYCRFVADPSIDPAKYCGNIGFPPCTWDPTYCATGEFDPDTGICIACGEDYFQPCCTRSEYPCLLKTI